MIDEIHLCEEMPIDSMISEEERNKRLMSFYRYLEEVNIPEACNIVNNQALMELQPDVKTREQASQTCHLNYEKTNTDLKARLKEVNELVKKHLGTIDQLLEEKLNLTTNINDLITQLRSRENRFESTCKAMASKHDEEIRKTREMILSKERKSYEELLDTEKRKIKVRKRIICVMQQKIDMIEKEYTIVLEDIKSTQEKEYLKYEELCNNKLQVQLHSQKHELVKKHNELLELKLQENRKYHLQAMEEQQADFAVQKQAWQEILETTRSNYLLTLKESAEQLEREREELHERHLELSNGLESQYQVKYNQLTKLKDEEIENLRNDLQKQMNLVIDEKELEIKSSIKQERDLQIEQIIEIFIQEAEATENKIQFKFEKCSERHKHKIDELQMKLDHCNELLKNANLDRRLSESKLIDATEEMKLHIEALKDLSIQNSSLQKMILKMKRQNEEDMEELQSRVKLTIEQKNETIKNLNAKILELK